MTIPIYNSDARRRIRDSVHFTENFSRDHREKLRRGADTPCVVVFTKNAIAQGDIGPCYRATGSAFDSAMTPLTEEIEAWNPGPALAANTRVVIEPVALHGVGTMWGIVAPFSGESTPPVIVNAEKRIYQSPRWWEDLSPTTEETQYPGYIYRTDIYSPIYRVSFDLESGSSVTGLTQLNTGSSGNFRVAESMTLLVELQIQAFQLKLDTPSEPDPAELYLMKSYILSSTDDFDSIRPTAQKMLAQATFTTTWDGDGSAGAGPPTAAPTYPRGDIQYSDNIYAFSGFMPLKFTVTPPSVKSFYIVVERVGGATDPTDYGFQVTDMILSISRIA